MDHTLNSFHQSSTRVPREQSRYYVDRPSCLLEAQAVWYCKARLAALATQVQ